MGGVTREKFLPKLILFQMAQALFCIGTITYQERLFSIITLAWPSSVALKVLLRTVSLLQRVFLTCDH